MLSSDEEEGHAEGSTGRVCLNCHCECPSVGSLRARHTHCFRSDPDLKLNLVLDTREERSRLELLEMAVSSNHPELLLCINAQIQPSTKDAGRGRGGGAFSGPVWIRSSRETPGEGLWTHFKAGISSLGGQKLRR